MHSTGNNTGWGMICTWSYTKEEHNKCSQVCVILFLLKNEVIFPFSVQLDHDKNK